MWEVFLYGLVLALVLYFHLPDITQSIQVWRVSRIMNSLQKEGSNVPDPDENLASFANVIEKALDWAVQGIRGSPPSENLDTTEHESCGCLSKSKAKLPYEVDKIRKVVDLSRPMPTREDTVAILKNGHVKLAYVINIDHGLRSTPEYANLVGSLLTTELIPSGVKTKRCIEEAFVVDRGFSLGETVVLYQNEFADDPKKAIERSTKRGMIGQIINAKITGDLLVLPGKTYVARDIDLSKVVTLEMVNFNSAHNYVLYKDWIGDLVNITNDITMLYNGHRFTVRDNGSLTLIRKDRSDDQKSCVPGEVVQMLISDVLSSNVKWEKEMPFKLRRLARKKNAVYGDDSITCLIDSVEPVSVEVKWLMSPSSVENPSKIIEKAEFHRLTKVDISANARVAADDRVRVETGDDDEVITLSEYNKYIDDQYSGKFEKKMKSEGTLANPQRQKDSSTAKAVHKAASPPGDDGAPPEKNAKVGFLAEASVSNAERMEPITEHEDESMHFGETTTDGDDQDGIRSDAQRGLVRKAHRPRMKRARVKRIRRSQPSKSTNKPTSRRAKELFGDTFIGEVLLTRTTVDVEWMNGTISYNMPGCLLVPVDPDLDQQDHLPGVLVARKDDNSDELGVILQTDQKERCARVRWLSLEGDKTPIDKGEEECTLFDFMPHPLYQRMMIGSIGVEIGKEAQNLSDIVFQVKSHLKSGQSEVEYYNGTRANLWPTEMTLLFVPEDDDDVETDTSSESDNETSWANWSSQQDENQSVDEPSTSSDSKPNDLTFANFIVKGANLLFGKEFFFKPESPGPKLSYSEKYIQELVSQGKTPSSKEIAERARLSNIINPKDEAVIMVQSLEEIYESNSQALLIEKYILGTEAILTKAKTEVLSPEFFGKLIRSHPNSRREGLLVHYAPEDVDAILAMIEAVPHLDETCFKKDNFYRWLCIVMHADSAIKREYVDELYMKLDLAKEELEKQKRPEEEKVMNNDEPANGIVKTLMENTNKGTILTLPSCSSHNWRIFELNAPGKMWMRRIMNELRTLREHLPEGIHVITYEDRADLLSTIIVGPRGTPYEATPFYFDIRFKVDYPCGPPEVHYHAFSQEQLNPNLYQNGRVCTSLLGTWQGKGVETWSPTSSNLLQVLLSIQGLILVPEPFFNEAGYEARKNAPGMIENSQRYNETAMINSLQYLETIAKFPPEGAKTIVKEEFKKHWPILKTEISSWLEERTTPDFPVQMSKGFRISLERMVTRISALNMS